MSDIVHPIETWLQGYGVQAKLHDVRVEDIDVEASLRNQARSEPLLDTRVDEYARRIADGSMPPPLVGFVRRGKIILVDGNQRLAAFRKLGYNGFIPIYELIDVDDALLRQLTWNANVLLNGEPPSPEERRAHAVSLLRWGYDVSQVVRETGLSRHAVSGAHRADEVSRRAERLGIKNSRLLAERIREKMLGVTLDAVFVQIMNFATRRKSPGPANFEAIRDLVNLAATIRNEDEAKSRIGAAISDLEIQKRVKPQSSKRNAYTKFHQSLTSITRLPDAEIVSTTSPEAKLLLIQLMRDVGDRLERLESLLEK